MRKLNSRFYMLVAITIIYGLCLWMLIKRVSNGNDINEFITYISTIIAIIVCLTTILRLRKKSYVYVSYSKTETTQGAFEKLKAIYRKRIFVTILDDVEPGDSLTDSMMIKIHESSFCIVLIDKELSPFQKKEIKEMKRQNKRIVPILVTKDTKIPTSLSYISFITLG